MPWPLWWPRPPLIMFSLVRYGCRSRVAQPRTDQTLSLFLRRAPRAACSARTFVRGVPAWCSSVGTAGASYERFGMRFGTKKRVLVAGAAVAGLVACAFVTVKVIQTKSRRSGVQDEPAVPLTEPSDMCNEPLADDCLPPGAIEACLRAEHFEVLQASRPKGGTQGARVLTVRCKPEGASDEVILRAKWRVAEAGLLSDPRRELVAYELQKLFLRPEEYVVPPVVARCLPLDAYRETVDSERSEGSIDSNCVLGYLNFWLEGVELADKLAAELEDARGIYSPRRFEDDELYARKLSRLSLLAVFVNHGDSHPGQFVVAEDPFRMFSIDHSISLSSMRHPMVIFREDLSELILPSIPSALATRVLALEEDDVLDLRVVASLAERGDGLTQLAEVPPHVREATPGEYLTVSDGLLIGTTDEEREVIWNKIMEVQSALVQGTLAAH